jgi:excisionase family DNA binding protein
MNVDWLTPDELAAKLKVSKSFIYDRTRKNGPEKIPHIRLGKYLRFDTESPAFREWLKRCEVVPGMADRT